MRISVEHHCEQTLTHACVAACVGMVLRARGEPHDEAVMMAGNDNGFPEPLAAKMLRGRYSVVEDDGLLGLLDLVGEDRCLIVRICGPRYIRDLGESPAGHQSRHGRLAAPGERGGPHAVLVIDADESAVTFLDPYYPAEGQPIVMTRVQLLGMFMGDVIDVAVARRS